jgi:hypothetical protein
MKTNIVRTDVNALYYFYKSLIISNYCGSCLSGQNRQNLRIFSENPQKRKSKRKKPDFFETFKKNSSFYLLRGI